MRRLTTEEFIKRAKEKFDYDYSITIYKNKRTKIKFICPKHGIQEQLPENHIKYGCGLCGRENGYSSVRLAQDKIIKRFKKIHGNKYDYSLVEYKNIDIKVKIICPIHGIFEQSPYEHLKGGNCPYCYGLYKTTKQFIEEANKVHNNRYDYSLTEYKKAKIKVKIICPIHGVFEQIPNNHLSGQGCPDCSNKIYKGENIIPIIKDKETLFRVCDAAITFFEKNANPGERFRLTLQRVGEEEFRKVIQEAYNG